MDSESFGFYRSSACASGLALEAANAMVPVVMLGSIYTDGVTPETPVVSLLDPALVYGDSPQRVVVVRVETETVENEMSRAVIPRCPPALLVLRRAIPKMLAEIKAKAEGVLVIVDPLPGPSVTSHLMLMACDTVVVSFDGTRESRFALSLFLRLVPGWLEQYKPILRSRCPRIVVFATRPETGVALAKDIVSRLYPSAVVVAGSLATLLEARASSVTSVSF